MSCWVLQGRQNVNNNEHSTLGPWRQVGSGSETTEARTGGTLKGLGCRRAGYVENIRSKETKRRKDQQSRKRKSRAAVDSRTGSRSRGEPKGFNFSNTSTKSKLFFLEGLA